VERRGCSGGVTTVYVRTAFRMIEAAIETFDTHDELELPRYLV